MDTNHVRSRRLMRRAHFMRTMVPLWKLFPCFLQATLLTHLTTIFYSRTFQWRDFVDFSVQQEKLLLLYRSKSTKIKAALSFFVLMICIHGLITSEMGAVLTTILAVPQLVRVQGSVNREFRVLMGPLTPILAFNNLHHRISIATIAPFIVSFVAFVVLRPDNTEVLDLFLSKETEFQLTSKIRRRLHGLLASVNALIAFWNAFWYFSAMKDNFSLELQPEQINL